MGQSTDRSTLQASRSILGTRGWSIEEARVRVPATSPEIERTTSEGVVEREPATPGSGRFLGVDAAGRRGWVGIIIDDDGFVSARVGGLAELVDWAEPTEVIGIDIPIGHVPGGSRRADVEARRFVGVRASSVFSAPPADIGDAGSYEEANALLASLGSPKMSRQAWALVPKMAEAAELARSDDRVFEVHPEVSFRELSGAHLRWSKKSWNGLLCRRELLADAGIELPDVIPEVDGIAADDVVDAAIVAWTARRIADGSALSLPDPPEVADGRAVAIWR